MSKLYTIDSFNANEISEDIDNIRARILKTTRVLKESFIGKDEAIDMMAVAAVSGLPLLLIGRPGTAKSDLVVRFCEAMGVGSDDYFEYMLTKFTEPTEVMGPIDVNSLQEGKHRIVTQGMLPEAQVVFLDEIFKANSAILNTLLTVVNERKYYNGGVACPVNMQVLFAATNEIPTFSELDALKDRFILKVESKSVKDEYFDELMDACTEGATDKAFNLKPWRDQSTLEDFVKARYFIQHQMRDQTLRSRQDSDILNDRRTYFPDTVYSLFKRIIKTLETEDGIEISDRKIHQLYKLLRAHAFIFSGGVIQKEDLRLLKFIPNKIQDIKVIQDKVERLLNIG